MTGVKLMHHLVQQATCLVGEPLEELHQLSLGPSEVFVLCPKGNELLAQILAFFHCGACLSLQALMLVEEFRDQTPEQVMEIPDTLPNFLN